MASFTVRIFSASSSGISMSNASSNAIPSSTVSSESAPRSSTKEALGVTSPSSTPSCSTTICFTFSSTEAMCLSPEYGSALRNAASAKRRPVVIIDRKLLLYLGVLADIVHRVLHAANFFGILIGNFDIERFFERHHEFDGVKRVGAEVI